MKNDRRNQITNYELVDLKRDIIEFRTGVMRTLFGLNSKDQPAKYLKLWFREYVISDKSLLGRVSLVKLIFSSTKARLINIRRIEDEPLDGSIHYKIEVLDGKNKIIKKHVVFRETELMMTWWDPHLPRFGPVKQHEFSRFMTFCAEAFALGDSLESGTERYFKIAKLHAQNGVFNDRSHGEDSKNLSNRLKLDVNTTRVGEGVEKLLQISSLVWDRGLPHTSRKRMIMPATEEKESSTSANAFMLTSCLKGNSAAEQ